MKSSQSLYRRSLLLLAAGWLCSFSTGKAAVLFSENFDGVVAPAIPAGWTATANGVTPWRTSTNFADTLPNAVFAADAPNVSTNILISPSVLVTTTNAQLTFRHKFDLEFENTNYYDGGVLEISIGGGSFIDFQSAGGIFTANGYVGGIDASFQNPLSGRMAWTGNSAGFVTTTATLPASAAGSQVQLRWYCGTDETRGATGWYVDSVLLTDGSVSPIAPTITNVSRSGNNINFSFATVAGQNYTVEYKNSLSISNWTTLQGVTGDGTTKLISDSLLASPQRFYRVKSP